MQQSNTVLFIFLVFIAPWFALWLRIYLRPHDFSISQSVLYRLSQLLTRFLWRTTLCNRLDVPEGQGALLICNHRSSVDPFFIQTTVLRKTHWMVAKEYCVHPAFRWFLAQAEVIPTNRGGVDTASTKAAIRLASSGEIVGMFPEGRINITDQLLLPCRPGAMLVAMKAKVPVVPCYIEGSPYRGEVWSPLLTPAKVKVRFGKPIDVNDYAKDDQSRDMQSELLIRCLKEVAKLAGQPDFEPRLAGKRWKPTDEEIAAEAAKFALER